MNKSTPIDRVLKRCVTLNRLKLVASLSLLISCGLAYRIGYQDFNQVPSLVPFFLLLFAVTLYLVAMVAELKS